MCIAILLKKGADISDEALKNSFENNNDGAGIAYTKDKTIYLIKGIFNKDEFIKSVRDAQKVADGDMLIHCRIGTSGLRDKNNCHPHIVNDSTVLIHNGVLDIKVPKNSKVSDTVIYINTFLKELPKNFMYDNSICNLIENHIGSNNKFVLLNNSGDSKIINENAGIWKNNVWYSNTTFETDKFGFYGYGLFDYYDSLYEEKCDFFQELVDIVDTITPEDAYNLGSYPMVDLKKFKLVKEKNKPSSRYMYLDDLSWELHEMYLEKYSAYEECLYDEAI